MNKLLAFFAALLLLLSGCGPAGTVLELELTENYSPTDPFVNAKLFYVTESLDALELGVTFEMEGETGLLEIADNDTGEVFWSSSYAGTVAPDPFSVTLEKVDKEKEYAVRFTGTGIQYAKAVVTSQSGLMKERERPAKKTASLAPYEDVRGIGETRRLRAGEYDPEDIASFWFNQNTVFEGSEELAEKILEGGKDPGLQVSGLHAQGVTGKGVTVAVIDQPLLPDHPEYAGKILKYHTVGLTEKDSPSSMHGPAVASLLAGESIGTAPGAKLYYIALKFWERDAAEMGAEALDWLIEENKALPEGEKIRAVSVSADFTNAEFFDHPEVWEAAVGRAKEAGLLVLDCRADYSSCVFWPSRFDPESRDDVSACEIGTVTGDFLDCPPQALGVPVSYRTTAEEYTEGEWAYSYDAEGGHSWAVPYGTGVLALGWQLNPGLTGEELIALMQSTAFVSPQGGRFLDPVRFIEAVRATL